MLNKALAKEKEYLVAMRRQFHGVSAPHPRCVRVFGTGNPALPDTALAAHSSGFDADEDALVMGAGLYAGYALAELT